MNFRSYKDLLDCVARGVINIDYHFDLVVSIPRSGIVPATIIALHKNVPVVDISGFLKLNEVELGATRLHSNLEKGKSITHAKKVLIVDDSVASGETFKRIMQRVESRHPDKEFKTLAIYASHSSKKYVDFYFDICPFPRFFEWNIFQNKKTELMDFDMDGVLCADPTEVENDDSSLYKEFILNAKLNHRPDFGIGNIVTSRLEKYRVETEFWLRKNGISYKELIMLDGVSAKERRDNSLHVRHKVNHYRDSDSILFIESSRMQAYQICKQTSKPVLCSDTGEIFNPSGLQRIINRRARSSFLRIISRKLNLLVRRELANVKAIVRGK